ncbi:hypothetical protein [Vibrio phage vB_VmeM-Yong XC32]|nr:hypothetical protein [Vibrio phage vB_VmeM-Yong XC31]QAX96609.1 hypothetical protein [Vibrio phage vB_VmeM-Yong XC32]QAX96927.1 hypothetical protein [Vibrio phage vB_VmeM-Yong MS31]QAX97232.1 hypothetical protein [Vibrio phage vB_VmeM-Yong MS32]
MSDTIHTLAMNLRTHNSALYQATKDGKWGKMTITKDMLPATKDVAEGLVYLDAMMHHFSHLYRFRLTRGSKAITESLAKQRAKELANPMKQFCDFAFTLLYPTSATFKQGRDRLWLSRTWVTQGIRTEQALAECALMAIEKLAPVTYTEAGSFISLVLEPIFDLLLKVIDENYSVNDLIGRMANGYTLQVAMDLRWSEKLTPDGTGVTGRFPVLRKQIPLAFRDKIAVGLKEYSTLTGLTLPEGTVFKSGKKFYAVKTEHVADVSIDADMVVEF